MSSAVDNFLRVRDDPKPGEIWEMLPSDDPFRKPSRMVINAVQNGYVQHYFTGHSTLWSMAVSTFTWLRRPTGETIPDFQPIVEKRGEQRDSGK